MNGTQDAFMTTGKIRQKPANVGDELLGAYIDEISERDIALSKSIDGSFCLTWADGFG